MRLASYNSTIVSLLLGLLVLAAPSIADDRLRPYLLLDRSTADAGATTATIRSRLEGSGFTVVGEYQPYEGATTMAVTHPALLQAAADSGPFGGYGAVLRLAATTVDGETQVSIANPVYWGEALQVGDVSPVATALGSAFPDAQPFGSKKGLTEKKLAKYRYMMMMPRLRDHDELGSFADHATALATIRNNLSNNDAGLRSVFEVAIPGRDEVLFGVAIADGDGGDATVMATTDQDELRHTAHLPYGLLVSGDTAYALAGKFRIALAFPDLGMGTFMKISGAPNAIRDALTTLTTP